MVKVRVVKCTTCKYKKLGFSQMPCKKCDLVKFDKWESTEVVEDVEKSCKTCGYTIPCDKVIRCNGSGDKYKLWIPNIETKSDVIAGVGQDAKQVGKFENIGMALGELVDEKQQAYGDAITAVEQMMKVLYPNGVKIDQYRDMLLMVRIMDKQCRIAKGDKSAFGESPFKDIAGYGLLGVGHGS